VLGVEIECCARCGGQLKIIASIEEPQLIAKILSHLERAAPEQNQSELPGSAGRRCSAACCELEDEWRFSERERAADGPKLQRTAEWVACGRRGTLKVGGQSMAGGPAQRRTAGRCGRFCSA
jgi:hypothetical protein